MRVLAFQKITPIMALFLEKGITMKISIGTIREESRVSEI